MAKARVSLRKQSQKVKPGGGSKRARPGDLRRGLWIYAVAYLILTGLVAALMLLKLSA